MILLISAEKFNRYLMIHNDKSMVLPASELKKEIKNNKRYAVVCLGGGRIDRYKYSIEIFKLTKNSKIIFCGISTNGACMNISWAELGKDIAEKSGCNANDIIMLKNPSSTFEEAFFLKEFLRKNKFDRIIIISDPFHMRRIKMTYKKIFKDDYCKLIFSYPENSWYRTDNWWKNPESVYAVATEYLKLLWYKIRNYIDRKSVV